MKILSVSSNGVDRICKSWEQGEFLGWVVVVAAQSQLRSSMADRRRRRVSLSVS